MRLSLLFLLAVSMLGQAENEAFFSLSSSKTFPSDGAPTVSLNAWNVDSLEFRVYRINDPVRFFQNLDQPHEFGGHVARPQAKQTPLERVHAWKHSLRTGIRRALRGQFTESPSAHVNTFMPRRTPPPAVVKAVATTQYAEAPILNPDQLVLTFIEPVRTGARWDRQDVKVPVSEKGVYLVEGVNKELRAYTILFVSDLTMISKAGKGHILNYVVDRKSGQPVAGIPVSAVWKGDVLSTGHTGSDGSLDLPLKSARNAEVTVIARRERDVAANSISYYGGGDWVGYIYSDRPVYRPGHTVYFRAMLRTRATDAYEVPAGQKVSVEIDDPDQKPVYQKTLTVSANGTIHDDLQLAATASLGSYFIQVKREGAKAADNENEYGDTATGSFEVEAYRKPEYEVRVTPAKPRILQGETGHATIDARYFFGEPVSGAKVKYSIYRSRYWNPFWYDPDDRDDTDQNDDQGGDYFAGDQVSDQEGVLDADGKLQIDVPTEVSDKAFDMAYRVEAHVTDAANREIAGSSRLVVTFGNFAVNVTPTRYVYEPGTQADFVVEARDYDNQPVQTKAHVIISRWDYRNPQEDAPISSTDLDTDTRGEGRAQIAVPSEGGSYRIRVTAKSGDRNVSGSSYIWVSGTGSFWGGERNNSISIIPDRKTYKSGDTAKVMIVAGQPGTAVYVSLEGQDVRQYKLIRSQSATAEFEFPVEAKYEPGVTVTATYIRDGMAYTGQKYVRIPPLDHQLNVRLSTDKPQYRPGDSADYSLDVTDASGKPVPRAELSLGVVDEAIYGVRPDITPNILSFFFGRGYDAVVTSNSLDFYFMGQAGKRRMQLADLRARSHLAQLKPERLVQPKVRKAFPDTAFWAPELVTDANGHAHAKVDFPDSLTTWRATARGIGANTSVGSAALKTIVRKNLILRLTTPRFLVAGDEITISALVHNYLQTAKQARVSLDVKGLTVVSGATQDVMIPSRGEAKVDWRIKAGNTGTAVITGKALTDEESDALEIELPVNFPGIQLSSAHGGSIVAGSSDEFDMSYPQNVVPGSRTLSVSVSPTVTGSLFSALEYLTSFPYGCVEQTMSSFLPDIVVKDAVQSLHLKTNLDNASLTEKIQSGLDRLYSFQHEDGGWGWWETDASHPFMTAYVVSGLVQARNAGTKVRDDSIERGVQWLRKELVSDSKLNPDLRAYLVYALTVTGQNDPASLVALLDRKSDLSPWGLAMLGLALENAKDAHAAEIASALESNVQQDGSQAWWIAKRDPMLDFDTDASPEATAFILRFLSHEKKDDPLLPKAALWLVNHRNQGYWWESTKQTAMVIYSMIDYVKSTQELTPNLNVVVSVNGKAVLTRKFDSASAIDMPELKLDESSLQPGANHIRITTSGSGRAYYGTRAEYHTLDVPSSGNALALNREYFRLVPGKSGDTIVYDTVPLDGPVAVGDTIAVHLTLTGSTAKYLLIEDPIPAGTEFIEKDGLYKLRAAPPWWQWYFDRREMHDDHMAIFQTSITNGHREYFYLLKVVNSGIFQVNPAKAAPLYQTDLSAVVPGRTLEVR